MNQHPPSRAVDNIDNAPVLHVTHDPDTGLPWPDPTTPEPEFITLAKFLFEAVAESTDGCLVEPDGIWRHGHPAWLMRLGVILRDQKSQSMGLPTTLEKHSSFQCLSPSTHPSAPFLRSGLPFPRHRTGPHLIPEATLSPSAAERSAIPAYCWTHFALRQDEKNFNDSSQPAEAFRKQFDVSPNRA